jgi:hypothetical protein
MAGLVPAIHDLLVFDAVHQQEGSNPWMAGTRPAMTSGGEPPSRIAPTLVMAGPTRPSIP